ncbi:MAG: glucoamylase family protein, partial [Geminicoccaceae bacterium]
MNEALRDRSALTPRKGPRSRPLATASSAPARPAQLDDDALLDLVQRQTFRYFWDFAHPVSGLARERSNPGFGYGAEVVCTGGSGFGIMTIIVAVERRWISREAAVDRLLRMVKFLYKANSYHGILPHFLDGETGRTAPFTRKDDGGDLVETSFLIAGLLCARQYFAKDDARENELRARINGLWGEAEWDWHTRGGLRVL